MSTVYLAIARSYRPTFETAYQELRKVLQEHNFGLFSFVDEYLFSPGRERLMMETAEAEIASCSLFIAEGSKKAIGVGIETGMAKSRNIPIIYIRQRGTPFSTTLEGCAQISLVYDDPADLTEKIRVLLQSFVPHSPRLRPA
ncbi:MAG: hypothetical protein AAFR61_23935 [Bacteroidota bacterium]